MADRPVPIRHRSDSGVAHSPTLTTFRLFSGHALKLLFMLITCSVGIGCNYFIELIAGADRHVEPEAA